MKRADVEKMLKGASKNLAPDIYDKIAATQVVVEPIAEEAPIKGFSLRQLAVIFSIVLVFLVFGSSATFIGLYTAEAERVYIDLNPSVEVVVNRFDRVIKVSNFNTDASSVLSAIKAKGLKIDTFVDKFIIEANNQGYIESDGAIFISVASSNINRANEKAEELRQVAQNIATERQISAKIESQNASDVSRKEAVESNISVGKLKAIQTILETNTDYSFEELKDMDMRELKTLIDTGRSNAQYNDANNGANNSNKPNNDNVANPNQIPQQSQGR